MKNKNARASALAMLLVFATPRLGAEVIVTGSAKRPLNASPVAVVTKEMIDNSSLTDLSDIIQQTPGVATPQFTPGGTATINIRGLNPSAVPVIVDGVQIYPNENIDLNTIPTHMIDRVEILRGPQGSQYGSSAISGAINVVTRTEFQSYNVLGSSTLQSIKYDTAPYSLSYGSNEECDATDGAPLPFWLFDLGTIYGDPDVSQDGDILAYGDQGDSFSPPSLYLPQANEAHGLKDDSDDILAGSHLTFDAFNELRIRIRDYPDAADLDKERFIFGLFFESDYLGHKSLSDDAALTGKFNAEALFQQFLDWSKGQTDADRAEWSAGSGIFEFFPYAGIGDIPALPAAGSVPPPEATKPLISDTFTGQAYPPDSAIDLSKCDDTVKDEDGYTQVDIVNGYLVDRRGAEATMRGDWDYVRAGWEPELDEEKGETLAEARERRDNFNDKLKAEWQNCLNGDTAATPAEAPAALSAEDREFLFGLLPGNAITKDRLNYTDRINLKAHFEYADLGNDAPKGPVDGLAGRLSLNDFNSKLGLPFIYGAYKDSETGAGLGTLTEFSDKSGTMTFADAIYAHRLSGTKPNYRSPGHDEPPFRLGESFSAGEFREAMGKNWTIYYDYDSKNVRGGASVGIYVPYFKVDSVYLETVPGYNSDGTQSSESYESELFNSYGSDYFSIGGKNFYTYTYPEYGDFDFSLLDKERGATYWTNNECGDPALPPEGSGYLAADESSVKSLSDRWALEHVGLKGDEPALDEFAKPVIVAVIDTGLDWHHLDFSWDNLWRNEREIPENGLDDDNNGYVDDIIGWSFTDNRNHPWDNDGHGTAVAGIIAATQGNDAGIDGINGAVKIMVLKALNNFGRTRASYVAKAIVYAADNGAQLINLSVTGPGFPKIVQDAVDYAAEKGVLVINAAGNKAEDIDVESGLLRGVLTVAATGPDDERAIFSNYGNAIDVAAPGVDVVSLRARATDFMYNSAETSYVKEDAFLGEDRRYYRSTGTSFATPIVTGVASLVLANNPGLKPAELKRVLEQSARDVEAPGFDRLTGFGLIDARAALAADPAYFVNSIIAAVRPMQQDGQSFIEIAGVADAEVFGSATIEIGQGEDPDSWTEVGIIVQPVQMDELARIPVEQFEGAETWTIRLVVTHLSGSSRETRHVISL